MADLREQIPEEDLVQVASRAEENAPKGDSRNMQEWTKEPQPGSFRDKFRKSRYNDGTQERT